MNRNDCCNCICCPCPGPPGPQGIPGPTGPQGMGFPPSSMMARNGSSSIIPGNVGPVPIPLPDGQLFNGFVSNADGTEFTVLQDGLYNASYYFVHRQTTTPILYVQCNGVMIPASYLDTTGAQEFYLSMGFITQLSAGDILRFMVESFLSIQLNPINGAVLNVIRIG